MNPLAIFMGLIGRLPLSWLRLLGQVTGWLFYAVSARRRHVVLTNLKQCFPQFSESERQELAKTHFRKSYILYDSSKFVGIAFK